jgi:hypothetical protein
MDLGAQIIIGNRNNRTDTSNIMKKLTTAALLVGGAILASQSAFGQAGTYQTTPNDLLLGFQNQAGGGTEDYIINLGLASSIVDSSTVVNLSSDFSLSDFNAVLGSSSSMFGGVIGAANSSNSGTPNTADVFLTQSRGGGAGTASVAGSVQPAGLTKSEDDVTYSQLGTLVSPAVGTGTLDTTKSWESLVDPANGTGSFQSDTGVDPDSMVSPSSVFYEDLWGNNNNTAFNSTPFTYEGYFTLDLTGASPSLTFTPVPEPSNYLIGGLGGVLMLALRLRRNWSKA